MSNEILDVDPQMGWSESWVASTTKSGMKGYLARRAELSEVVFEGYYTFDFGAGAADYPTFQAFFAAREGAYDSFLWKARAYDHYQIDDEAVGTGDGATTSFALDMKHVDGTGLTVYIDGAEQTSGYTLNSNNTAPVVVFDSAVTNTSAVTASYPFYMPVIFADDRLTVSSRTADLSSSQMTRSNRMTFRQNYPGSHKVA